MLTSMTGIGVAEREFDGRSIRVEIRSVNSRFLDFSARLPGALIAFENEIKQTVQEKVQRGKVTLSLMVSGDSSYASVETVDEEKISRLVALMRKVAKTHKLAGDVTVQDVLSLPNIFIVEQKPWTVALVKKFVAPTIECALEKLCAMKNKEGAQLAKDIEKRLTHIETALTSINASAHAAPARLKERLERHLQKINEKVSLDASRLEQEIAYLVEKCDITEEIVRLGSHIRASRAVIEKGVDAGKQLDFLTQEMNREINTIGSKSQDIDISQHVVAVKLSLEKIREQVQNVE